MTVEVISGLAIGLGSQYRVFRKLGCKILLLVAPQKADRKVYLSYTCRAEIELSTRIVQKPGRVYGR